MRALVTGGAGFIGSTVVDGLLAHDHEVLVVDDLSSGSLGNLEEARRESRIGFHRFDICSEGLRELIFQSKPEAVLHIAAQASVVRSVHDPLLDARINIMGLLNVLEGCVAADVRKVVFASSGGTIYGPQDELPVKETAIGRPASPYGITKRAAEDYLRYYRDEHGLDFISLALANVYGPRQDPHGEAGVVAIFCSKVLAGEQATIFGTGEFTRDFVFVEDVAHAFVLACDKGTAETVNIGTGVQTSIEELHRLVAEACGFDGEPAYGPERPGDIPHSALDPRKARKVLGWEPWTPAAEGVKRTVDWFRTRSV